MESMHFSIATLGCKSNQYESQAMAKLLTSRGHKEVSSSQPVDAYIINTCSVTAVSDKKSRQMIRKIRKENPDAFVAVCGCYAQISPEEIAALEVDVVGGTGSHLPFIEALEKQFLSKEKKTAPTTLPLDNPRERTHIESLPSGGLEGRTRALLKIQDGCQNYCTYCIIPYTRGTLRSLPLEEAMSQIQELIAQGFKEIVLTGIEISSWGVDLPEKPTLAQFILEADNLCAPQQVTLRLGSLEPRTITEEFCSMVKDCSSLAPHFHLSLQSGSDSVLKRMNRKYDTARYLQSVQWLRDSFQHPAITTDLIVGFPQETEEESLETLAFLKKSALSSVHVFPYSQRSGTPADKMTGQVEKSVKEARSKEATSLTKELKEQYEANFLNTTQSVLFETVKEVEGKSIWTGHSPQSILVTVESALPLQNQRMEVAITEQTPHGLTGTLVEEDRSCGTCPHSKTSQESHNF